MMTQMRFHDNDMMTRLMSNSVRVVSVSSNLGLFFAILVTPHLNSIQADDCSFICVISYVTVVKLWIGSATREAMAQYTFQRELTTTIQFLHTSTCFHTWLLNFDKLTIAGR